MFDSGKSVLGLALLVFCTDTSLAQEVEPVNPVTNQTDRSFMPVLGVSYQINEAFDVTAYGSQLFGDLDPQLALARLRYTVNDMWGLGLGYFGLWQDGTAERPDPQDQRIRLEAYLSIPLGSKWLASHRSRAEHRFRDVENGWRYRPNFRLQRSLQIAEDRSVNPFVFIEPFYDLNESDVTSVEYAFGINLDLIDSVNLEAWATHTEARGAASDFQYISLLFTYSLN